MIIRVSVVEGHNDGSRRKALTTLEGLHCGIQRDRSRFPGQCLHLRVEVLRPGADAGGQRAAGIVRIGDGMVADHKGAGMPRPSAP